MTASPLTALLGDSNGDFAVNVMDVIHDVDYILGMNPQPFIFNAADVNNDLMINVLDVVGTVDIILNPVAGGTTVNAMAGPNYYPNTPVGEVTLTWENGTLVAESQHAIAGLQLALEGTHEVTFPAALAGMEKMVYQQEGQTIVLLFNFANQGFDAGRTELFSIADGEAELDLTRASVANDGGAPLTPVFRSEVLRPNTSPAQNDGKDWLVSFPNPPLTRCSWSTACHARWSKWIWSCTTPKARWLLQQSNLRNAPGISAHTLDVQPEVRQLRRCASRHSRPPRRLPPGGTTRCSVTNLTPQPKPSFPRGRGAFLWGDDAHFQSGARHRRLNQDELQIFNDISSYLEPPTKHFSRCASTFYLVFAFQFCLVKEEYGPGVVNFIAIVFDTDGVCGACLSLDHRQRAGHRVICAGCQIENAGQTRNTPGNCHPRRLSHVHAERRLRNGFDAPQSGFLRFPCTP